MPTIDTFQLITEITGLQNEKQSLLDRVSVIEQTIQQKESTLKSLNGIPHNDWSTKAIDCIENEKRFMQTFEVFEYVGNDIQGDKPRKNAYTALSLALNNLCKSGRLGKVVMKGRKGYYYGLPEWFEGDGLKPEHVEDIKNRQRRYKKVKKELKQYMVTL